MGFSINWSTKQLNVDSPTTSFTVQELVNYVAAQQATLIGISNAPIAVWSGKDELGPGVSVGITMKLINGWQVAWWGSPGTQYTGTVGGGNLIAASGDAFAQVTDGPQIEISLSAAATIVDSGGAAAPTAAEIATAVINAMVASAPAGSLGATVKSANQNAANAFAVAASI